MLLQYANRLRLLWRWSVSGFIFEIAPRKPDHFLGAVSDELFAFGSRKQTAFLHKRCNNPLLFAVAILLHKHIALSLRFGKLHHTQKIMFFICQLHSGGRFQWQISLLQTNLQTARQNCAYCVIPCTKGMLMQPIDQHEQFCSQHRLCVQKRCNRLENHFRLRWFLR